MRDIVHSRYQIGSNAILLVAIVKQSGTGSRIRDRQNAAWAQRGIGAPAPRQKPEVIAAKIVLRYCNNTVGRTFQTVLIVQRSTGMPRKTMAAWAAIAALGMVTVASSPAAARGGFGFRGGGWGGPGIGLGLVGLGIGLGLAGAYGYYGGYGYPGYYVGYGYPAPYYGYGYPAYFGGYDYDRYGPGGYGYGGLSYRHYYGY